MSSTTDEGASSAQDGNEDSTVIRELRQQVKALSTQVSGYKTQEEAFNQVRASSVEAMLIRFGFPGLKDDVLEKVEGMPTEESVKAFLEVRGLKAKETDGSEASPDGEPDGDAASAVANVAGLGQQVASAAQRSPADKFAADLEATENVDEVAAVMAKHGLNG